MSESPCAYRDQTRGGDTRNRGTKYTLQVNAPSVDYKIEVWFIDQGNDRFAVQLELKDPDQTPRIPAGVVTNNGDGFTRGVQDANAPSEVRLLTSGGTLIIDYTYNQFDSRIVFTGGTDGIANATATLCLNIVPVDQNLTGPIVLDTEANAEIPAGCPTLLAFAYPSPDGKQICYAEYTLNTPRGPCVLCNEEGPDVTFTSQSLYYKQYCFDLTSVLCGVGCTLVDRVTSLAQDSPQITTVNLVTYALLRLILAQVAFGDFQLMYLRRCYWKPLQKKLQKSQYCSLLARLESPGYYGYRELFLP